MARFFASRPTAMNGEQPTLQSLRDYAISLLARREYSASEIRERCLKTMGGGGLIDDVVVSLQKEGLQSDKRFAELFVKSRIARRQGVQRIVSELKLKGIGETLAKDVLRAEEIDWCALASEALVARFSTPSSDPKERARQQRFLAGRGFNSAQIVHAMDHAWRESREK